MPVFTVAIVEEKELKLRALMTMMGLSSRRYLQSKWMYHSVLAHSTMFLLWALGQASGVLFFTRSSAALLIVLMAWAQLMVALSLLASCAFSRSHVASIVMNMVVFGSFAAGAYVFITIAKWRWPWKMDFWPWQMDFWPPLAFSHALGLLGSRSYSVADLFGRGAELTFAFEMMVLGWACALVLGAYLGRHSPTHPPGQATSLSLPHCLFRPVLRACARPSCVRCTPVCARRCASRGRRCGHPM